MSMTVRGLARRRFMANVRKTPPGWQRPRYAHQVPRGGFLHLARTQNPATWNRRDRRAHAAIIRRKVWAHKRGTGPRPVMAFEGPIMRRIPWWRRLLNRLRRGWRS